MGLSVKEKIRNVAPFPADANLRLCTLAKTQKMSLKVLRGGDTEEIFAENDLICL
jgi:hypothetical protein